MIFNNKAIKYLAASLVTFLGLVIFFLAQDVVSTQASPPHVPATTTPIPTEIPEDDWYWSYEVVNLTHSHPGTTGTYWSDAITAPGYDDVEAVYFEVYKGCPSANSHWVKSEWKNTEGGSWTELNDQQGCDTLYKGWWDQAGGQSYADAKAQITSRFGYVGDTAANETNASTETDYRAGTSAGTNGDAGYTSTINVYYLHYGAGACDDDIELGSEPFTSGTIDATLEDGITEDLADGGNYAVEISGGPWDDGSVSTRYDAAYSWDGVDWEPLDSAAGDISCVKAQATGGQLFYIEAQSDTLYLRVNDEADEFDDNADDLDYAIYGVVGAGESGCGANYTLGNLVFSESWDATFDDWLYSQKSFPALTGVYFENYDIYRILIPHTYQDGSQYNAEAQFKPQLGSTWVDLDTHPQTVCVEDHDEDLNDEEGWISYYFKSPEDFTTYQIRANDLDGDQDSAFDNNAGGFAVEVYTATYNPPVAGCAALFDKGPLIQNVTVPASASNGVVIPNPTYAIMSEDEPGLLAGTSYMIEEPIGWEGMYYDGGGSVAYFDWEISPDRSTWYDIDEFAICVHPQDDNHDHYYFDAAVSEYYVRAKDADSDGSWSDQGGTLSLNLYYADDLRTSPDANGSCPNLTLGSSIYSGSVGATNSLGGYLPDILTPGQLYAIQLTTPAWTNNGADQKAAQIKLKTDKTFKDFETWEDAFCSETDGNDWPTVWIQALDTRYQIRADGSIADNAGWVNYTIYEADWTEDPIYPSCESDYNPLTFADFPVLDNEIKGNWNNGQALQDFILRQGVYKIKTTGGPWYDNQIGTTPLESYDLQISLANGAENTWEPLASAAACVVPLSDGKHSRYYLEIEEGFEDIVKLRVDNQDWSFLDNTGSVGIEVQYSASGVDPDAPWDPYEGDEIFFQSGGCDLVCVKPSSSINVPAWLEYFRCQLIRRLSFCNYHVNVLIAMKDLFYNREPFGSIQELAASFGLVRAQVESYQWAEDQGGDPPEVQYPDNFIFASEDGGGAEIPIVGDETIWGSGEIDLVGSPGEYSLTCTNNLAASLGDRLGQPLCFIFNVIDSLGLSSWFQLFWDLSMLMAMGMYFQNRWLKPMSS